MHLWRPFGIVMLMAGILTACGASATASTGTSSGSSDACPSSSATPERTFSSPPPMQIDVKKQYTATIQTQYGNIVIQLLAQQAPTTVNNFVFLACHKFYDGLTFHRIIPGFVIQGGDPQGNGAGGPGYTFKDELPSSSSVYTAGAVAMANSGPNTNGSQFFICVADDTKQLQPLYSYFGKVTQGMDTVQNITKVQLTTGPDGQQSKPITPVVMQHVTIAVQ